MITQYKGVSFIVRLHLSNYLHAFLNHQTKRLLLQILYIITHLEGKAISPKHLTDYTISHDKISLLCNVKNSYFCHSKARIFARLAICCWSLLKLHISEDKMTLNLQTLQYVEFLAQHCIQIHEILGLQFKLKEESRI